MDLRAVSDHLEITQLLYRYARAIDTRELDGLDQVFTPDAEIHYDFFGGVKRLYADMKPWLREALRIHRATQHCMTNALVELEGDAARATTYLHVAHVQQLKTGGRSYVVQHGTYHDRLVRTPAGWRIRSRRLENVHIEGRFHGPDAVELYDRPDPR